MKKSSEPKPSILTIQQIANDLAELAEVLTEDCDDPRHAARAELIPTHLRYYSNVLDSMARTINATCLVGPDIAAYEPDGFLSVITFETVEEALTFIQTEGN